MSKVDTWMPLYVGDYLADTMHLEAREHGAYLLLLMHYWRTGPLPTDDRALAVIARVDRASWIEEVSPIVRPFFDERDGRLHQKRMEFERLRSAEISTKRRAAANRRHHNGGGGDDGGGQELLAANAVQLHSKSTTGAREKRRVRMNDARDTGRHTEAEWEAMLEQHGHRCASCGGPGPLTKDHKTPVAKGGSDAIANLQPLCHRCNSSKGARCNSDAIAVQIGTHARPVLPSTLTEKESAAPDSRTPRESPPPKMPALGDPPASWMHLADGWEHDTTMVCRPVVAGEYLDLAARKVCEAAGIRDDRWRGDWDILIAWLRDGLDLNAAILPTIKRVVARPSHRGFASLRFFDAAVREARAAA